MCDSVFHCRTLCNGGVFVFSKEMKKAVDRVQQVIKTCNSTENIAIVVTDNITKFNRYIEELDPTGIVNAKRNIFNKMKEKWYWQKVTEYYPSLENLLSVLCENQRILANTQNTLDIKLKQFEEVYNGVFKAMAVEYSEDKEYLQQAIVAENTHTLLLQTIDEYKYLDKKVESILSLSKPLLDTAMLIAKNTYKLKIQTEGTIEGIADMAVYLNNYTELKRVLV